MMSTEKVRLSASKIKTFFSCSWRYYCSYLLKLPDSSNDGAKRGSVVHIILESLANPRHRKYYLEAVNKNTITGIPPLDRLLKSRAKVYGVNTDENIEMMEEMTLVALNNDFLCRGSKSLEIEKEFFMEFENFFIRGFIDKKAIYEDDIVVFDYKTSKKKNDDIENDYQGLMYSMATFFQTGKIPSMRFLFLRFNTKPEQHFPKSTASKIMGFVHFLNDVAKNIKSFKKKNATQKFASGKDSWLCGRGSFVCPFKDSFKYYEVVDKDGKTIETALKINNLKMIAPLNKIVQKKYGGCPKWH
jgi:hypothetical protein